MPQLTVDQTRSSIYPKRTERNREEKQVLMNAQSEAEEAAEVRAFYASQEASLPAYRAYGAARKARRPKK
jgi:hypothetical protein